MSTSASTPTDPIRHGSGGSVDNVDGLAERILVGEQGPCDLGPDHTDFGVALFVQITQRSPAGQPHVDDLEEILSSAQHAAIQLPGHMRHDVGHFTHQDHVGDMRQGF